MLPNMHHLMNEQPLLWQRRHRKIPAKPARQINIPLVGHIAQRVHKRITAIINSNRFVIDRARENTPRKLDLAIRQPAPGHAQPPAASRSFNRLRKCPHPSLLPTITAANKAVPGSGIA